MSEFDTFSRLLTYRKTTGKFYWKKRGVKSFDSVYSGKEAGTIHVSSTGRKSIKIKVKGKNYFAHRVAWLLVTGKWPEGVVDHKDHDSLNNKWNNLRDITQQDNMRNRKMSSTNTSGYPNVYVCGRSGKYIAKVMPVGVIGRFDCPKEASKAASKARMELGYSESHGKSYHFA